MSFQHDTDTCSTVIAAHPQVLIRRPSHTEAVKYTMPTLLHQQVELGPDYRQLQVARPRGSDSDAGGRSVLTCYITNVKAQKRCIADFLIYAIVFALGISRFHYMTTNIIYDI